MKIRSISLFGVVAVIVTALSGCSPADAPSSAPELTDDTLQSQQAVSWSTATMTSGTPDATGSDTAAQVRGSVTWTGSGTFATGGCLMVEAFNTYTDVDRNIRSDEVPCSTESDCSTWAGLYVGGAAHCRAWNNSGQKYCFVRPGPQSQFCVGTPANGSQVTVPTTLTTGWKNAFDYLYMVSQDYYEARPDDWEYGPPAYEANWLMDGCFSGCGGAGGAPTTPSDSSLRVFYGGTNGSNNVVVN